MVKILGVAPYEGIQLLLKEISKQYSTVQLDTILGDMQSGLIQVKRILEQKDYDVIISRGGTAKLLKEQVSIPVVDLGVSQYDILQVIQSTKDFKGKRAIVGFESITNNAEVVVETLQENISIFTINKGQEVFPLLKILKEQNFDMILGDMITVKEANKVGLNSIVITSSIESIENAMKYSIQLVETISKYSYINDYLSSFLIDLGKGLIIYDTSQEKVLFSLKTNETMELIEEKKHLIHFLSLKDQTIKLDDDTFLIKKYEFHHHSTIRIVSIEKMFYLNKKNLGITVQHAESSSFSSYDLFYRITENERLYEKIESYCKKDDMILITGEKGVGKDFVAELIHKNSNYSKGILYQIDCSVISESKLLHLLMNNDSFFFKNQHTFYFKGVNLLSKSLLTKLSFVLEQSMMIKRNKVIFSFFMDNYHDHSIALDYFEEIFEEAFSILRIHLAPLRERKEYIPNLATIYINKLNKHNEKQISGINKQGLQLLREHDWKGNYGEFKRVLKELFYSVNEQYIKYEHVQTILNENNVSYHKEKSQEQSFTVNFSSKDTLEDINMEIIAQVLLANRNNKTLTAKKLGISRSTLWRFLKYKDY